MPHAAPSVAPRLVRAYQAEQQVARLYHAEPLELLRTLQPASTDIVLLNLAGCNFDAIDSVHPGRLPGDGVQIFLANLVMAATSALKLGGAFYLLSPPEPATRIAPFLRDHLSFHHWIALGLPDSVSSGEGLYAEHWALLHFTKGDLSAAPDRQVALSDFWVGLPALPGHDVVGPMPEATEIAITERLIEISGSPGGLFVDPLSGSGAMAATALTLGMSVTVGASDLDKLAGASHQIETGVDGASKIE